MARRTMKGSTFDLAYYQTDQVIALFEPIVEQLVKDLPAHQSLDVTASTLSLLAGQLQQFQQDYMGILSRPGPTAPTRIPSKSFKITKPLTKRHPLFTILLATLRFRIKNNWPKWDFTILSKRNMELIHSIRSELIRRHQLQPPRITFDASVPSKDRKKLIPLIRKVEG
ncbi:hypothetical protein DM01DRAFT_1126820 [Hesseltinella vesiculosa]|uniref:Chromo domain-containing protein n=1 Tax=Hesseltinella vesiculosa TaxID=101127 RepID=A0A1X2GUH4_9FUNG|nr:hypothetical protein DM01DRAFT_1126820 [Hesseltinella vesiculosa]